MTFKKSLKFLEKIQKSQRVLHSQLITQMNSFQFDSVPDSPNKVVVNIQDYEQMLEVLNKLSKLDKKGHLVSKKVESIGIKCLEDVQTGFVGIKQELADIVKELAMYELNWASTSTVIQKVIHSFRERCRGQYLDHLKVLDREIRRILKPLVPSQVVDENIKYPEIPCDLLESIKSNKSTAHDETENSQESHMALLISTLETVAKELIELCNDTNHRFYEIERPSVVNSEPPTPLAAPLPEYFVFDNTEIESGATDQDILNVVQDLERSKKEKLIKKLIQLNQQHKGRLFSTKTATELTKTLTHQGLSLDLSVLSNMFENDNPSSITSREKLVYDIINSERFMDNDVTLNDIMEAETFKFTIADPQESLEVSKTDYEDILRDIKENDLKEDLQENEVKASVFASLSSTLEEKNERASRNALSFFSKPRKSLPPLGKQTSSKRIRSVRRQSSASKLRRTKETRSITPVQRKQESNRANSSFTSSKGPLQRRKSTSKK